jgi:putative transposase
MIDKGDKLSVTRQCDILDLSRSGIYYRPVRLSAKDRVLMRQIDEIHLAYLFYGSRKIRNELWARGTDVGRDRVRRLMRLMGIEALYVKPRLSLAHPAQVKYPYLLRGLEITRANHAWAADICYIPTAKGFCYLVAIMNWASRMVLAWRLSNTLDSSFCYEDIYLKAYGSMAEVNKGFATYFQFYNEKRWHQNFDRKTPAMVYFIT